MIILLLLCLFFYLSDNKLDSQLESQNIEQNNIKTNSEYDTHSKAKLQIQAACCALVGELAFNEVARN